jgi:outer membrane protein TolC
MIKKILCLSLGIVALGLFSSSAGYAQTAARQFTLNDIITRAQANSPAAKQAETRRKVAFQQNVFFVADYRPTLRFSGEVPGFNRAFDAVRQPDGTTLFQPVRQTNANARFFLQQPIAPTGGQIFVNSQYTLFNDLDRDLTLWNGTLVNVAINQPLFAFNELKWNKRIEPLRFEEARRTYVEQMEFISRQAVDLFFQVLDAQTRLIIAESNLENTQNNLNIERNRYNIGGTTEERVLQVELGVLTEQQNLAQAELNFKQASLQLRSFIGLNEDDAFTLILPEQLPDFEIPFSEALTYAKQNRADFLAFERRRIEAEAGVAQAKGQRFQVNLSASYGLNNRGDIFSDIWSEPNNQQRANINFNVPILDFGRNKARLEIAMAQQQLETFTINQEIINFEQEILTQVDQFPVLRNQIELSKRADEIAETRYNKAQERYENGLTSIIELNQALVDKDQKKIQYLGSLRDFWRAYYDIRRLTLYDFQSNELLYNEDMEFEN